MKIAVIFFTDKGEKIAIKIKKAMENAVIFKGKTDIKDIFDGFQGIVFISAAGIAVRLIAPYIKSKTEDPAVVVIDDIGRFSISLLSGHLGGANELALKISKLINAEAIITTASDGRGIEAPDIFAKRCGFLIEDMEALKKLTSIMVNCGAIAFKSEMKKMINYSNIVKENYDGALYVTSKERVEEEKPYCILRPKNLVVGVGCKRGKPMEEILSLITQIFNDNNLSMKSIGAICSMDVKKNEKGIIDLCSQLKCDFKTFSMEEIKAVEDKFDKSDFVAAKVGVSSVCEPAAYLGSGKIIVKKTAQKGITIAVGRREELWQSFM
ncbi:cobalt-precorrin 5A hydrolase [Clostridium guangxiense]|uniref:cobalt-precorrin 5A hydrolase n=1 Tax=Clostridium guangxiense TaxID=1662055 RepID=UPI001E490B34|nr:cobalt-precorrin 5A hydrolase [Clostridium guangxiense]MCD2348502.1 cobalt-precorrin 5A hydrolase [Clostridium guangxiense]